MLAAEYKTAKSTVRIHDEYCEIPAEPCVSHLVRIITASYRRRRLANQECEYSSEIAAANPSAGTISL